MQVVGGNLTAENLVKIAEVAEKYGDGHVHLTSRQSVEIPFIKIDDVDEVKEEPTATQEKEEPEDKPQVQADELKEEPEAQEEENVTESPEE